MIEKAALMREGGMRMRDCPTKINRREFVRSSTVVGAGLLLYFHLPHWGKASPVTSTTFEPNAYIRIASNNVITLWVTRSEMGQGVRTNLPAALAEELDVDLSRVQLEQAMPGPRFKGIRLRTSGSGSSSGTFMALRTAGATAREMLISAAAERWGVDRATCRAQLGRVIHVPSDRHFSYGELAEDAARLPLPKQPPLKEAKDFRFLGKSLRRTDGLAIATGTAQYGIDVRVPGMLFAVMERCPYIGGKLAKFDAAKTLAVPGVRHVVPIQRGIAGGVAVVADHTWAAFRGRDALKVEWDPGPNKDFDSDVFIKKLAEGFTSEGYPIRREGNLGEAMRSASKRLEAVYEYPFQAHAPLETMNCTADVRTDSCEIWVPTQTPDTAYNDAMQTLGLGPDAVKVHTTLLGGGFGRRLIVDYVHEAVELSKAIGKPVQLLWSRPDDMRCGFFHPASLEQMAAGIGADGRVASWKHKSVGSDLSVFGLPTEEEKKDLQRYAKDESPWGAFDTPYAFPAMQIDYVPMDSPVPTGAWRSVDYPSRVFARESFLDEVAHAAGRDPFDLRMELLQPGDVLTLGRQRNDRGRMIRVLEAARERCGWKKSILGTGKDGRLRGRGLALNIYDAGSYMAQIAEVSVASDLSGIRVHKIYCVFDCGLPINPAGLEGQVESGITWGLSATLHGKIDFRKGQAVQSSYSDFRVMHINEIPTIETQIVPSTLPPSGFGEHPVPPVAPAVANAIFAATGKRVRKLPITPESLRELSYLR